MKIFANSRWSTLANILGAVAAMAFTAVDAAAAAPRVDDSQLLGLGFKVLVATTKVQLDWVKGLPPGQIKAMQRTGKKFFIYPDAARSQIYVGGPAEYAAYQKLHPQGQQAAQDAANKTAAYRSKRDAEMRLATAQDLSDPFLGVSWADLGW
jgi:hypothetical protein